jgi:RNA polymerase sigma-70 factor (ECF subfamily)
MGGFTSPEPPDDLLERCRRGDAGGFTAAFRAFGRMLYGTALRIVGRPEDAEDVVQDTFLSFCRDVPDIPQEHLHAWLRRVTVNHCIDRLRRGKRWKEEEIDEATHPLAARPSSAGVRIDLERAVASLPDGARLVFLLHDVEGYKHREIGEILGMKVGTTKSQLFRARAMLRDALDRKHSGREAADGL